LEAEVVKSAIPDVDALLAANGKMKPGGTCSVRLALDELDKAVADKMTVALADRRGYSATGLSNVFRTLGQDVGRGAIERHRRGACRCD
jgi:hypothetical protein